MELQFPSGMTAVLGPQLHGLAWVLTYSLHAALWAAAAALLSQWGPLSAAARHRAWQSALLAPFATTLLSFLAVGFLADERAANGSSPAIHVIELRRARDTRPMHVATASLELDDDSAPRLARALNIAGAAMLASAGLGLVRYLASSLEARRRLVHRRPLEGGEIFRAFERACARSRLSRVSLSQSPNIDSPLVLGRAEVCVPASGLEGLSGPELEAVFAHELAHLERGDGVWFPIIGLTESLLWFHPITGRVCAQVRQSAELACDARAVEQTGEPRALALALTHIASRAAAKGPAVLATMAHPRGGLVRRVAQLTRASSADFPARFSGARALWVLALVGVLCVGSNLRVAEARPSASTPSGVHAHVTELSREVNALAVRAQVLEAELQSYSRSSPNGGAEPDASARLLELEQELRHTRAMQEWLEQQLLEP